MSNTKLEELKNKLVEAENELKTIGEKIRNIITKIKAEHEFKEGEKIRLITERDGAFDAFIQRVKVNVVGNHVSINYRFLKCKKDGTPSKHSVYVWGPHTIQKIEDAIF